MDDSVNIDEMIEEMFRKAKMSDIDKDVTRDFTRKLSIEIKKLIKESPYDVDFVTVLSIRGGDGKALAVITSLDPEEQHKLIATALKVQSDPSLHEAETM